MPKACIHDNGEDRCVAEEGPHCICGLSAFIVSNGSNIENEQKMHDIEKVIRKFAHYTIYTIGGFLIMNYAYTTDKTEKQKIGGSVLFGAFYAGTDELHQYFVPGRSARLFDVGIDTLGVLTGIGSYIALRKCIERILRKNAEELKAKM